MSEIEVPVWCKSGGMMIRRDALEPEHPDSTYSYIKNMGLNPEDYGYYSGHVSEEQKVLLESIPNEVLWAEMRKRERLLEQEANFS